MKNIFKKSIFTRFRISKRIKNPLREANQENNSLEIDTKASSVGGGNCCHGNYEFLFFFKLL